MKDKLQRVHIFLDKADVKKIHEYYDRTLGFSAAIRQMVKLSLAKIDAKVEAKLSKEPTSE